MDTLRGLVGRRGEKHVAILIRKNRFSLNPFAADNP